MRGSFASAMLLVVLTALLLALAPEMANSHAPLTSRLEWGALLIVVLAGAAILAVRERYAFCMFLGFVCTPALAFAVLLGMWGELSIPASVTLGVISALGLGASIGFVAWSRFSKDPIPDLLRGRFPARTVFEKAGVQFTTTGPAHLRRDTIAPVEVVLQNCTSAAKTVEIVPGEAPLLPRKSGLRWRSPSAVTLGPSEVKRVRFPVAPTETAAREHRFHVGVRVSGEHGQRTRRWRAQPATAPLGLPIIVLTTLFLLPLGFLLLVIDRGGLRVRVDAAGNVRQPNELPEPEIETLWGAA